MPQALYTRGQGRTYTPLPSQIELRCTQEGEPPTASLLDPIWLQEGPSRRHLTPTWHWVMGGGGV
jgi:hypothetical protein